MLLRGGRAFLFDQKDPMCSTIANLTVSMETVGVCQQELLCSCSTSLPSFTPDALPMSGLKTLSIPIPGDEPLKAAHNACRLTYD